MKKKIFVGIKIPRTIINTINMVKTTIIEQNYYNWSSGNNLHITTLFIGYQNESKIDSIKKNISQVFLCQDGKNSYKAIPKCSV